MDKSLKDLESQLEGLVPRGLSDKGRGQCMDLLDRLAKGETPKNPGSPGGELSTLGVSWKIAAAAASIALGIGLGGGWMLGSDAQERVAEQSEEQIVLDEMAYEVLDSETWLSANEAPKVYVTEDGEVREVFSETAVTKELVKHHESGKVITLERTDHHLIDSAKSEF